MKFSLTSNAKKLFSFTFTIECYHSSLNVMIFDLIITRKIMDSVELTFYLTCKEREIDEKND